MAGLRYICKRTWPNCKHIVYVEWWFNPESELFNYDEDNEELRINKSSISKQYMRNSLQALELVTADCAVSPTLWQREQLPKSLQSYCRVIHDGRTSKNLSLEEMTVD